jgi:hypothetical protein
MFLINMKHLVVLVALIAVTLAEIKTAIMEDDDQYRAISSPADRDQDTIGKFGMIEAKCLKKKPNVEFQGFHLSPHQR